jgi:hypothetical protein
VPVTGMKRVGLSGLRVPRFFLPTEVKEMFLFSVSDFMF